MLGIFFFHFAIQTPSFKCANYLNISILLFYPLILWSIFSVHSVFFNLFFIIMIVIFNEIEKKNKVRFF